MTDAANEQKPFSPHRWASVLLRSVHVSAMGVVLGGVFLRAEHDALAVAIWTTLLSGCLMMLTDLCKSPRLLLQGNGLAVILKLALLATGFFLLPEQRFVWYLAATLVASIGSHMPGRLRHYDILKKCDDNNG
ncbi:MAG: hypothetical protein LBQ86_02320 [Holophagales bacterium]|jgi:ABC-type branched-subunit amino acid transport system permease subunit|nr:hypothetical protein [Holophagales bacterium]